MRIILALLSPIWLLMWPLTQKMITWQAKMIGGAQYFSHVGIGTFIAILYLLMGLAMVVSLLLLGGAISNKVPRPLIYWTILAFLSVALITYMPILTNGRGILHSMVFPYHLKPQLLGVLGLAVVSFIATKFKSSPQTNA